MDIYDEVKESTGVRPLAADEAETASGGVIGPDDFLLGVAAGVLGNLVYEGAKNAGVFDSIWDHIPRPH